MDLKTVLIAIVLAVVVIFVAIKSFACHFECPDCGAHFHISFLQYLFTSGVILGKYRDATWFSDVEVTCPKCGNSNRLTPKKGRK